MIVNFLTELKDPITKQSMVANENEVITFFSFLAVCMREFVTTSENEQNLYKKLVDIIKENVDGYKNKTLKELEISFSIEEILILKNWFYKLNEKSFIIQSLINVIEKE